MPIYEYKCDACGHVFEHFSFTEEKSTTQACPRCGKEGSQKVFSSFSSSCGRGESSGGCGGGKLGFS